jgi:molecular chaperone GrpE
MLPVADNLRRALESLPADARETDPLAAKLIEGVELTERSLISALERHGVKRVEALGQLSNPHLHQVMMEVEDPAHAAGTIVLEMQAGYTLQGRLLRESMVGVAKGGPKPGAGPSGVDTQA